MYHLWLCTYSVVQNVVLKYEKYAIFFIFIQSEYSVYLFIASNLYYFLVISASYGPRVTTNIWSPASRSSPQYFLSFSLSGSLLSFEQAVAFLCLTPSRKPSNFQTAPLNFVLFNIISSPFNISSMYFTSLSSSYFYFSS